MEIYDKVDKRVLIDFSGEHLWYEIRMLYGVSEALQKDVKDFYIYNALLESFVIHTSIILDFFYQPQDVTDDARAAHYMVDVRKWKKILPAHDPQFSKFHKKRNKEVVHLSYARLELKPEEKKWAVATLTNKIKHIVNLFLQYANPEVLHPKMYQLRDERHSK